MHDEQTPWWVAAQQEFAALPTYARNALLRGGYRTRAQVAAAPDDALLRIRKLGRTSLAQIRQVCGGPLRACPHCGGDLTDWLG